MDKKIIARNFSKNASTYDDYAGIQKKCARKLITFIKDMKFSQILEIGCGTGLYSRLLCNEFPKAKIIASDLSDEMLERAQDKLKARHIRFERFDGETFRPSYKPNLITSNVCFQWFSNLEAALESFSKLLMDSGVLCFSMYGSDTFMELRAVLGFHFGHRGYLSSSRFITRQGLEDILRTYYKGFILEEKHYAVNFDSIWDFLSSIKYSGTRGEGLAGNIFLGKYRIREIERTYLEKFGRICATHHVYFCRAKA